MKLFKKSAKEIMNPIDYLHERFHADDTYTIAEKQIANVSNATCRNFDDNNNCTLVALSNITAHYATNPDLSEASSETAESNVLSNDVAERYKLVREFAVKVGYDGEHGIPVFKNRRFAKLFCKAVFKGSEVKARCHYFISRKRAMRAIDANRPFLLSLASGYYFDHTVAVYGYANYTNDRTGKTYTFLMLKDSWRDSCRYLAWKNTGAMHITCMTELIVSNTVCD